MSKRKIVIIGGGFGGVKAALELAKDSNFDITLISANSDFRIYSTLYRVATGGSMKLASVPLEEIFTNRNVKLVIDTAKELNRENTTIKTGNGQIFTYHSLVCALGVTTNYFGIK